MVEPLASEHRVRLHVTGDDAGVLIGDRYRLRQVLLNLLSNAVKFTYDGTVTTDLSVLTADADHMRLRFNVIDEGVGIPPEKHGALFKRFSQADGSVTRVFGGTGLGLAISRELVELMDGAIGVESELGRGSIFWFELRLPRGAIAAGLDTVAIGRGMFPGKKILVVDDVELNRELFQIMLWQHGCDVDLTCDGAEAVDAVAATHYDLVLMDVHMPIMDGLAATRAIRAGGLATLPIYALTASGTPEQVEKCRKAGMNGHLLKPLSPSDLEKTLRTVLDPGTPLHDGKEVSSRSVGDEPDKAQASLETLMGRPAVLMFIQRFLNQLDQRFQSEDRETIKSDAHKVAGSAGLVGQKRLGELASLLEEACREGAGYHNELADVKAAMAEARLNLSAWSARLFTEEAGRAPVVASN